jgi:hypothetical protein
MPNIDQRRTEYMRYCILIHEGVKADWYDSLHPAWRIWGKFYEAFGSDSGEWHCKGWEKGVPEIKLVMTLLDCLKHRLPQDGPLDELELLFKQFLEFELARLNQEQGSI